MSRRVSLGSNLAEAIMRQLSNYNEILEKTMSSNADELVHLQQQNAQLTQFVRSYEKQADELKRTLEAKDAQIAEMQMIHERQNQELAKKTETIDVLKKANKMEAEPRGEGVPKKSTVRRTL